MFKKKTKIETPSHREKLLEITPHFKQQRIYQLMKAMDQSIEQFLKYAEEEGQDPLAIAYGLFKLLKGKRKSKRSSRPSKRLSATKSIN